MMIIIIITNKIVGKWRKLHDRNIYTLCLAPNIIRSFIPWVMLRQTRDHKGRQEVNRYQI